MLNRTDHLRLLVDPGPLTKGAAGVVVEAMRPLDTPPPEKQRAPDDLRAVASYPGTIRPENSITKGLHLR